MKSMLIKLPSTKLSLRGQNLTEPRANLLGQNRLTVYIYIILSKRLGKLPENLPRFYLYPSLDVTDDDCKSKWCKSGLGLFGTDTKHIL